ncbi:MAG: hypothetical protein KTR18_10120 [Acidiferrobacterales bacterium]|nr:hypothetical protein [Acidiferrobacterales bacterium]
MSNENKDNLFEKGPIETGRRKVVHAALIGGATATVLAPAKWTKPVVESVILPAHAVTSEVAADDGAMDPPMPVMRTFFGGVPIVVTNYPMSNQNEVQIADASAENDLLGVLTNKVSNMLVPEAHAQFSSEFVLCVDDNDGSLTITLEQGFSMPTGVVHYTGSGGFGDSIPLTTTCSLPIRENTYTIVLTDTNNGMVSYSITSSNSEGGATEGMIPEASCGLGTESCPVFEKQLNVN